MTARYIHLSARDLEDAVLQLHGLRQTESENSIPKLKPCPRCSEENMPEAKRCRKCGLILDKEFASNLITKEQNQLKSIMKRMDNLENQISSWLESSSHEEG